MKIAVAMSGGVDSSAAAAILKEQGHELVGFTMQLWDQGRGINVDENGEPLPSRCCSLDDVYDARRVAEELGFPFYVLNLERDFERATQLHQNGDLQGAVRGYLAILATHPARVDVRSNLGAAYSALGRYEEAIEQYKRALIIDGGNQAIRFNLALAYYKSFQIPQAISELQTLHAAQPGERQLPEQPQRHTVYRQGERDHLCASQRREAPRPCSE